MRNDIDTILKLAKEEGFYTIVSNGLLLKAEVVKWASERAKTCVNVALHNENADEVESLVRFARSAMSE